MEVILKSKQDHGNYVLLRFRAANVAEHITAELRLCVSHKEAEAYAIDKSYIVDLKAKE